MAGDIEGTRQRWRRGGGARHRRWRWRRRGGGRRLPIGACFAKVDEVVLLNGTTEEVKGRTVGSTAVVAVVGARQIVVGNWGPRRWWWCCRTPVVRSQDLGERDLESHPPPQPQM
ncbi:putative protein phosphatase 2C 8 [Acorus calamus]|uniref:Uncharacterized protein n=1 Tax=Acorus calamus TaxID=4465 RepID=A0AAV9FAT7_ACOCL|nr:putative protein phosphatase 2C 8 [Acorus calamus]